MIDHHTPTEFDLAADAILARPSSRVIKASAVADDFDPPYYGVRQEPNDTLVFHAEIESTVARMVKQIRDRDESQVRAVLKAAYDSGFEDASQAANKCCGCNTTGAEEFEGFLDRLIKSATTTQEDRP